MRAKQKSSTSRTGTVTFEDGVIAAMPLLMHRAMSLCDNAHRAEDIVQETVAKALAEKSSFQAGTNLHAWLITILKNYFFSQYRRRRREVEDVDGSYGENLQAPYDPAWVVDGKRVAKLLDQIPMIQQEALRLVGIEGCGYKEAAEDQGVPIGTIKSRVKRARDALKRKLAIEVDGKPLPFL